MVRRGVLVLIAVAALGVPAVAQAGGWASVSISPRPTELTAGDAWPVDLTVLQHGQTPLTGVRPAIVVYGPDGRRRFAARPTAEPGVYRALVRFPVAGRFKYEVDDGFGNAFPVRHPPVDVAPAAAVTPPEPGFPWALYGVAVGVLVLVGVGMTAALGGRAPRPA